MTTTSTVAFQPEINPLVLADRPIRSDVNPSGLSRFEDSTWDLTPGIFEDHSSSTSLNFEAFPLAWREEVKVYLWHVINCDQLRPLAGGPAGLRPSLRTVTFIKPHLIRALTWFDSQNIQRLDAASPAVLDRMLGDMAETTLTYAQKRNIINEMRRLWTYRDVAPGSLQLPESAPWLDERAYDLLGRPPQRRENLTPRISDDTLVPLLIWSLRFVEDFAGDISAGYHQYLKLIKNEYRHRPSKSGVQMTTSKRRKDLDAALQELKSLGLGLPGRLLSDGTREIRWQHLGRLGRGPAHVYPIRDRVLIDESALHIDDDAYLTTTCTGRLDGELWRGAHLTWDEIIALTTHLQTACFIVLTYLSGMRPGEALSLERDCLSFNTETGFWEVEGIGWKDAREVDGQKAVAGRERGRPWVVHPSAAQAIEVIKKLQFDRLLFPISLRPRALRGLSTPENTRPGKARTGTQIGTDIQEFIEWVNAYCAANSRPDSIPSDPAGRINPTRFRRTLAWHIVRRPRGLVAAAIQYGHVSTYITQGYSGTYASGFPHELAMEKWLERIEHVKELEEYLDNGGRLSGPAASELDHRARAATAKFLGRTIPTRRQAQKQLDDPVMQIHKGSGMHCVYDRSKALCARDGNGDGPDLGDCRSGCSNIARTDGDVVELKHLVETLLNDPLAPSIRYQRAQRVTQGIDEIIQEHENGAAHA